MGCACLALAGAAAAQGFYVGADAGSSKLEADESDQFLGPDTGRRSESDTGFRARFGYRFSRFFAAELGYVDFGELTVTDAPYACPQGVPATTCTFNLTSSTRGPVITFVASWPFAARWSLDGRVGALHAEVDTSSFDPEIAASRRHSSESNTALQYGLGLRFELGEHADVSLDWARFDQIGLGLGLGGDATFFDLGSSQLTSLGLTYRF
jgi:opacity protein-like surface antigen